MLIVEKYEDEHFAIPASEPIEAIKFLMEQNSLSRKDLEPYIGTSGRVSEVLRAVGPYAGSLQRTDRYTGQTQSGWVNGNGSHCNWRPGAGPAR